MKDISAIKNFIKDTLGCTCPDEVFDRIEYRAKSIHPKGASGIKRIFIGERLLIYIWEINDPSYVEEKLLTLMQSGKNERNRRGFNRFRLVIATEEVDCIKRTAEKSFKNSRMDDEKIDLHVVHREDVPDV